MNSRRSLKSTLLNNGIDKTESKTIALVLIVMKLL